MAMVNRVNSLNYTAISAIAAGKIDFEMKVCIVHLWTVPDKANPAEDGSIQMLLVEVNYANLFRNWRRYTVKRLTEDQDILNKFLSLHGINESNEIVDADSGQLEHRNADGSVMEAIEGGDSTKDDIVVVDYTSKIGASDQAKEDRV
ncbi:hypothetical protein TSUD_222060 [Trifolium subterraneum]|uniref:Uncharacterized protein n=1 Tax=Trifolium subterraneum TaxID=3900 RepID=A0A2Z6N6A6_TRISU|nr:hypothetical protein TSUD_222060 [Trifolium subterraneum]